MLENFYPWTHLWVVLHLLTVALQREGKSCWFGLWVVLFSSAPGLFNGKDLWRRKGDPFQVSHMEQSCFLSSAAPKFVHVTIFSLSKQEIRQKQHWMSPATESDSKSHSTAHPS